MKTHLHFLGTSDSKGVPRLGCGCQCCRSARPGERNYRTRSSLLLSADEGTILFDTPPEVRLQLAAAEMGLPDALFMTHPHNDHILGFADYLYAARRAGSRSPVYAPADVFMGIRQRFAYVWASEEWRDEMELHELTAPVRVLGWTLEAARVNHGRNGWSYGYLIERGNWRCGYFSDAFLVAESVLERWRGLDLLILGANFWKEEAPVETRSVYDVEEALTVAERCAVGQLILTHLSHTIDYYAASANLPSWASLAWDGRVVPLS